MNRHCLCTSFVHILCTPQTSDIVPSRQEKWFPKDKWCWWFRIEGLIHEDIHCSESCEVGWGGAEGYCFTPPPDQCLGLAATLRWQMLCSKCLYVHIL